MKKIFPFLIILILTEAAASAQPWSVGTNLLEYTNMGILNLEVTAAVAKQFSVAASTQLNHWTYNKGLEREKSRIAVSLFARTPLVAVVRFLGMADDLQRDIH